jgi:Outer membrane protein beta-barrel domain
MPNRFSRSLAICIFMLAIMSVHAMAQVDTPRVELGVHFTYARLRVIAQNDTGVGGRLTFNINEAMAVEGEYNYFPGPIFGAASNSRRQGLFGVKYGIRSESAGLFFKVRPGFVKFEGNPAIACPAITPGTFRCNLAAGPTRFAFDVGGVFELYPLKRTVVRFDVGDTMISYPASFEIPESFTAHNLQFKVGVGLRF